MASNLEAMASNLLAMASNLEGIGNWKILGDWSGQVLPNAPTSESTCTSLQFFMW